MKAMLVGYFESDSGVEVTVCQSSKTLDIQSLDAIARQLMGRIALVDQWMNHESRSSTTLNVKWKQCLV